MSAAARKAKAKRRAMLKRIHAQHAQASKRTVAE